MIWLNLAFISKYGLWTDKTDMQILKDRQIRHADKKKQTDKTDMWIK